MKNKSRFWLILSGIVALVLSCALLFSLSIPTIKEKSFSFKSSFKEDEVTLRASYFEVPDSEYAALICPGYSCDRQKWRPYANMCVKNGLTTMTFDYSGQGGSYGKIGFDNAKSDVIPIQIDDAIEALHNRSGIDYDHIILIGHSMGGRAILRLLFNYNESNDKYVEIPERFRVGKDIKNAILISPEVNYNYNAQASLFAGTSDAEEYPWKDFGVSSVGNANINIIGSTGDDVVKDEDCYAIYKRIGGTTTLESGKGSYNDTNTNGGHISLNIIKGTLHSYLMYSSRVAAISNEIISEITCKTPLFHPFMMSFVYIGWFLSLAAIFLILFGLNSKEHANISNEENILELVDAKKFLLRKLLMWLPGLGMALLIMCIAVAMPFGSPVMNIPYMCFIAGYGIIMAIMYKKGNFKGTINKLPKLTFKVKKESKKSLLIGIFGCLGIVVFVWYVLRTSMYRLPPLNWRLFWLIFATIIMSVGYYVSGVENDMLKNANASRKVKFLYNLIQYVPLFLLVTFYLVIGSYSGLIGQAQNMLLMYILCVPIGDIIRKRTGNRLYGALSSAFLFQLIMVTSAALISFF